MKALPQVNPATVPPIWRKTPLPLSGGREVFVYRGFARAVQARMAIVVLPGDIGGVLSRRLDAANDAIFNQYERDPILQGPDAGGVVKVIIPPVEWDRLVQTLSISERDYPGFSRRLSSTEIRVNSPEAGNLINTFRKEVLPPDNAFDFRGR